VNPRRVAWPTHECLVCDHPTPVEFGRPIFRWDYRDEHIMGGPAICRTCRDLAVSLSGTVTVRRVQRLREIAS
jgi:hypothetical protein